MIAALAVCAVLGSAPMVAPDNRCTPGAYVRKARADVCDGDTTRPTLPAAERRAIVRNYGVPGWSGASGELDHRVPLVLGGVTGRGNVWPEPWGPGEAAHRRNAKDDLEDAILRRVCKGQPHPMRVTTAVRVFLADWRTGFAYYVRGVGSPPV